MATVKLLTDAEVSANPRIQAVFDDIRTTRKSDFVNNFWRALANQPDLLERTWASIKQVMIEPGALDPLTKELIYIAVSVTNSCSYCIHSHTAAARAKGMTDQQHAELLAVIGDGIRDQRPRQRSPNTGRSRVLRQLDLYFALGLRSSTTIVSASRSCAHIRLRSQKNCTNPSPPSSTAAPYPSARSTDCHRPIRSPVNDTALMRATHFPGVLPLPK